MFLVTKTGITPVCGWCNKAKSEGDWARPKARLNRKWVCRDCSREVLSESLRKLDVMIAEGTPLELWYTEIPADFIPLMAGRFLDELRDEVIKRTPLGEIA